jgi:hypothetical protein
MNHIPHQLRFSILAFLLTSSALCAQGGSFSSPYRHKFTGFSSDDRQGTSVASAGDVDGDGFADIIVGAPYANPNSLDDAGTASVFSGSSGSLIYRFSGAAAFDEFGISVAGVGDINGDGFDDVIVGAHKTDSGGLQDSGAAFLYSGATGNLLIRLNGLATFDRMGDSVAGAGDVDGDGIPDIIVGAEYASPGGISSSGSVYVYSGATGNLIHQFNGGGWQERLGTSVSGAGDVNADGFDDLIVGAPYRDMTYYDVDWGAVYVYSGATGILLYQYFGTWHHQWLGSSVSGAGDVDGDGYDDFIAGAKGTRVYLFGAAGTAMVYSGATGNVLHTFEGMGTDYHLGASVSGAGDVNSDGFDDVIVGAFQADSHTYFEAGSAFIYSGDSGRLITQLDGAFHNDWFGASVSGAGDVNGDGFDDVIIGATQTNSGSLSDAGSAYVYTFEPYMEPSSFTISAAAGGSLWFNLDFPDSAAHLPYKILMSSAGHGSFLYGVDIPLRLDGMVLDTFFGNYPFQNYTGMTGTLNSAGKATAGINVAAGAYSNIVGRTVHFSSIVIQLGQLAEYSSVAVPITIVP